MSLISESKSNKPTQVTSKEIYSFVNFNDFDHFDPMEDTYEMFLNEEKKFSFTKYNELNEMLGMPKIEHESTFRAVLGL